MCASFTRNQLENWIKDIKSVQGRILDIGGSQQSILKRLNNVELYIDEYKILDLEQPHICKEKPDIIGDLNKTGWSGDVKFDYFDIVFCIEVMEYIYNPLQALKSINNFLKKDGILYLSTHFVYMIHNPVEDDCIRITPKGIEKLLKETGFEILEHKYRMAESPLLTAYYSQDKMRGIKDGSVDHGIIGSLIKCKKI